jgi:hypothetical protein
MSALHTPRKHYFSQVPFQLTFKTERFLDFILEVKFSLFSRIQTSHTEQFRLIKAGKMDIRVQIEKKILNSFFIGEYAESI